MPTLLDPGILDYVQPGKFARARPFPWQEFQGLLTKQGFRALCSQFPTTENFERHQGLERVHDQRPHDRLYLAYEQSLYHGQHRQRTGVIENRELPPSWRQFIDELEAPGYLNFVQKLLDVEQTHVRYAWHIGGNESEVSPHIDGPDKLGTHIFYFNSSADWHRSWGGETLLLGEKKVARQNPEFSEFGHTQSVSCIDNRSLLFRNGERAWHGVRPLTCPPGAQRRVFNVIFERPHARKNRRNRAPLRS